MFQIPSYASYANESYLSDQNHDLRAKAKYYSPEWTEMLESAQER